MLYRQQQESLAPTATAGESEPTGMLSYQALRDTLSAALACLPLIDKGNRMVDKCAKFAATLNHCLLLLLGKLRISVRWTPPLPFSPPSARMSFVLTCCLPSRVDQPDGGHPADETRACSNDDNNLIPQQVVDDHAPGGVHNHHHQYNGVPAHSYAPIPIDVSHFDLGALGWDNYDGFLSTLGGSGLADGFQETDLFC